MSVSRAIASFKTSVSDQDFKSHQLKICYLWYDEVLFEPLGRFDQQRFLEGLVEKEDHAAKTARELSDVILPLSRHVAKEVLEERFTGEPRGYPRWGERLREYTYPEPENAEQFAHNRLLEHIARERGLNRLDDGTDIEHAEGRARVAIDAVQLWERVNADMPCVLQAGPDEKLAMLAAQEFIAKQPAGTSPAALFEVSVPDLTDVPWQHIVKLRRDGAMASLRTKMGEAVDNAGADLDAAKKLLHDAEGAAIESIVESGRPRVRKTAIESIVANIPGLPVNPASLYFGVRDTTAAVKKSRELGWLYMLRDIRASATKRVGGHPA